MTSEGLSFVELGVSTNRGKQSRYTLAERKTHIEDWRKSGLSMREYCRRYALAISSFCQWVKKFETPFYSELKNNTEERVPWISHSGLVELILTNGIRIRFSDIANLSEVVRLVKALESCN
jgi:Fe-S cluster assembly scaffold protein SufB